MKTHTNEVQIIKQDGKAAFAVLTYDEYLNLIGEANSSNEKDDDVYIPHDVAEQVLLNEMSLMAAWRKHLKMSQKELAQKVGVIQSTISQMEKLGAKPQRRTIEKVAKAMGILPEQLID